MGLTVLVTGASGFMGRHLVNALVKDARVARVVCLCRRPWVGPTPPKFERVEGTLQDVTRWRAALLEADWIFHLGGLATFDDHPDHQVVNANATREMASILRHSARLKNLLFASSIGAVDRQPGDPVTGPLTVDSVPHPTSAYGRSKLAAEQALLESGIPCTLMRFTWVYGPGMRRNSHLSVFLDLAQRHHPAVHVDWPGKVSVIHVLDAVGAMLRALEHPNVAGKTCFAVSESVTLGELFRHAYHAVHGKLPAQLPAPPGSRLLSNFHAHLPLALNNLMVPYLCAQDPWFARELLGQTMPVARGIQEVWDCRAGPRDAWVVTGANSGIGLELAQLLSSHGVGLLLVDRKLDALSLERFPRAKVLEADLATSSGIAKVADAMAAMKVRCLVNNAGVGFRGGIQNVEVSQFESTLDVNCRAPFLLVKHTLPQLMQQGTTVVNVCSSVGYAALPGMSVYAASKSFLLSWSLALEHELRATNTVVTLSPSGTATGFQRNAGVNDHGGRGLLNAGEVARAIMRAVDQNSGHVRVGTSAHVMDAASRVMPRRASATLMGWLFERAR